jgi:hypothetical protein
MRWPGWFAQRFGPDRWTPDRSIPSLAVVGQPGGRRHTAHRERRVYPARTVMHRVPGGGGGSSGGAGKALRQAHPLPRRFAGDVQRRVGDVASLRDHLTERLRLAFHHVLRRWIVPYPDATRRGGEAHMRHRAGHVPAALGEGPALRRASAHARRVMVNRCGCGAILTRSRYWACWSRAPLAAAHCRPAAVRWRCRPACG